MTRLKLEHQSVEQKGNHQDNWHPHPRSDYQNKHNQRGKYDRNGVENQSQEDSHK